MSCCTHQDFKAGSLRGLTLILLGRDLLNSFLRYVKFSSRNLYEFVILRTLRLEVFS